MITKKDVEKAKWDDAVAAKWIAAEYAEDKWNAAKAAADTAYDIALTVDAAMTAAGVAKAAADTAARKAAADAHAAWGKYIKLRRAFQNARN